MGRYEDCFDYGEKTEKQCAVCGTDCIKLYYFEGEYLCEDCLLDKYYAGDASEFPTISFCERCGEPIEHDIYCVQNGNGDCILYDAECLLDTADE